MKFKYIAYFVLPFLFYGCSSGKEEKLDKILKSTPSVKEWKKGIAPIALEPWMKELKKNILVGVSDLPQRLPAPKTSQNIKIVLNKTAKSRQHYFLEWFCSSYSDVIKGYIPLLTMRGWKIKEKKKAGYKKNIFQLKLRDEEINIVVSKMPSGYFWRVRLSMFSHISER